MTQSSSPVSDRSKRAARRVALFGWCLLGAWALVLLALTALRTREFAGIWLIVAQQLLGGRALGIATGLSLGIPKAFLIAHCTLVDMVLIMVLYPLVVFGFDKATRFRFLEKGVRKAHRQAERYRRRIEGFGPPGLAAFVFFPLWSTGPLAGSILGTLMEMRTVVLFIAVAVGDLAAVAGWTYLFGYIQGFSETYGRWLPVAILVGIVVGWTGKRLLARRGGAAPGDQDLPDKEAEPESLRP